MSVASQHSRDQADTPPWRPSVAPELAVEALRVAARALDPRLATYDPKEQTLDVIQARLTAVLQAVGTQIDAVESIRAHLRMFEPAASVTEPERERSLPPHWRSRGPRPRRYPAGPAPL